MKGAYRFITGRGIGSHVLRHYWKLKTVEGHFITVLSFGLHRLHAKGWWATYRWGKRAGTCGKSLEVCNSAEHADIVVKADGRGRCTVLWRTEGGFKPPEIPKALQNRAKPNPIVKTVNNCFI